MMHRRAEGTGRAAAIALATAWLALGCGGGNASRTAAPTTAATEEAAADAAPAPAPVLTTHGCTSADRAAALAAWTQLRTAYPFHLQTVALSPRFRSGCRALIIAEPPPKLSLQALRELAPELLADSETRHHGIGYDGWTQDVVTTLPPLPDGELAELIAQLHGALFATTYRMTTLDTSQPAPAYRPDAAPSDLAVGPGELNRWLRAAAFTPLRGGEPAPFTTLLASNDPEVYLDDSSGLVAWVIPRGADIAEMAGLVRQFALESDLVVGAVASRRAVVVLARQRTVDPRVLPPLRFETVSLLAAVHDKDALGQSYERTNPLASRIDDTRDWAPIYLSPELHDTEYGSLLDIADQYLKGWSNNGKTQYVNFHIPSPSQWAFPAPVFVVANAQSFRYNWNTDNAGAVVELGDVNVFWLRRTSALNVSYFPDEHEFASPTPASSSVQALEETAYRFFTQTQTPVLVRVVQYNALYQIFARFGLGSSDHPAAIRNTAAVDMLQAAARNALREIRDAGDAKLTHQLADAVTSESKLLAKQFLSELRKRSAGHPEMVAEVDKIEQVLKQKPERLNALVSSYLMKDARELSQSLRRFDNAALDRLANFAVAPREAPLITENMLAAFQQIQNQKLVFTHFADPQLYKQYAASVPVRPGTWIHTPSIVLSWNEPPIEDMTGGHKLDAKVTTITVQPGRRSVAARRIAARRAVDAVSTDELDRLVLGPHGATLAPDPVVRSSKAALAIAKPGGFWGREAWRQEPGDRALPPGTVRVVKRPDGCEITSSLGTRQVATRAEAAELLSVTPGRKGKNATIEFEGFNLDEARGMVRVAEIRTRARLVGVLDKPPPFAKVPLNFTHAVLSVVETRTEGSGGQLAFSVTVPAGSQAPITIRALLAIRRASEQALQTAASAVPPRIQSLIDRFPGRQATAAEVGFEIRRDLRELAPDADILLKLQQEMTDFIIVKIEIPVNHGTHRRPS